MNRSDQALLISAGTFAVATLLKYFGIINEATYQLLIGGGLTGGSVALQQRLTKQDVASADRATVLAQAAGVPQAEIKEKITDPVGAPPPPPASGPRGVA